MVTYHPTTVSNKSGQEEITELLSALSRIENTSIVFTSPNLDKGSSEIREEIKHFCSRQPLTRKYFDSLGNTKYLSVMEISDAVVGNSSSGLLEAPTMKTSTVNIGGRQEGRIRADSVIDVPVDRTRIYEGISVALSERFNDVVKNTVNPYGEGTATRSIVEKLRTVDIPETTAKRFWDLEKE